MGSSRRIELRRTVRVSGHRRSGRDVARTSSAEDVGDESRVDDSTGADTTVQEECDSATVQREVDEGEKAVDFEPVV